MLLYILCGLVVCFPRVWSLNLPSFPHLCPGVIYTPYTLTCPSNRSLPISWYCNGTRLWRITTDTLTISSLTCNFTCMTTSGTTHSIWIEWHMEPVLQTLCAQPSNTVTCGQRVTLYCHTSANNVTIWRVQNGHNQTVSQTKYYNFTMMNQTEGCYTCSNELSSRLSNRICFWASCINVTAETPTVSASSTTAFKTLGTDVLLKIIPATTHAAVAVEEVKSTKPHIQLPFLVFMTLVALIGTMCGILGTLIFTHCQQKSPAGDTGPQFRHYYSLDNFHTEQYTQPVDWY
uniref:K1 glycoprotein n=2 Tax=Human herpesvirus 8 TaxID=37296 RepID=A0A1B1PFG6_HHV8|nr:K1 glycoprotein [Human gammaherpesvirus 8]